MKARELKEKGMPELEKMLAEKREKTRKLRFDIAAKQVKNTRELRNEKKDIARILTLIAEKNGE
jgi:large subunit ribosomal protein L29